MHGLQSVLRALRLVCGSSIVASTVLVYNVDVHVCKCVCVSVSYVVAAILSVLFILQEELPESAQFTRDWYTDFTNVHRLIPLNTPIENMQPKQFKGASEFCKISGLLCSYGLYQVWQGKYIQHARIQCTYVIIGCLS